MKSTFEYFSNSAAVSLALANALTFGLAANANAEPTIGKCGPADSIKAELAQSGHSNYYVYDVKLLSTDSPTPAWVRESIYATDGMIKGYYVARAGKNDENLCVQAGLSDFVLGDNNEQAKNKKIDPKFFRNQPYANAKGGLNHGLSLGAEKFGEFPVIQAKFQQADGGAGYITISVNPDTHKGYQNFSDLSGRFAAGNPELEAGAKPQTGYTPVARSVLAQMKPR